MTKMAFLNHQALPIVEGETILEFCRRHEQSIPTLCDDSRLDAYGSCRV
ncbi:MAG: hypothetical protein HRT35_10140, partial [Algicola sp.]|nr:hypothetical protein [Algicola sp.]